MRARRTGSARHRSGASGCCWEFSSWSAPSCSPAPARSPNGRWPSIRWARCCSSARPYRCCAALCSSCRRPAGRCFAPCGRTITRCARYRRPSRKPSFSSPLFATLISALVLKEAVGPARLAALVAGFLGVLIVTNPGADTFQIGALFALANAVLYGSVTAGVRGMTATESAETLTMYQMVLITFFFALALPFGFVVSSRADAAMLVFNGVSNAVGQYWWTRALHLAPASAVAPFYYLSLVWAMFFGYAIWGDIPTVSLLLGSAIVVASGLFLL